MLIDSIQNGIVIDHITAGKAMELYQILGLDKLACTVAILKNVTSDKLGRKDIIKIDGEMELDWDLIGYVDPSITVNIIRGGETNYIRATVSLYVSLYNIFVSLLSILGFASRD